MQVVKTLAVHQADVMARTHDRRTPLHYAAMSGHVPAVKTLVEIFSSIPRPASVSPTISIGTSPENIVRVRGKTENAALLANGKRKVTLTVVPARRKNGRGCKERQHGVDHLGRIKEPDEKQGEEELWGAHDRKQGGDQRGVLRGVPQLVRVQ